MYSASRGVPAWEPVDLTQIGVPFTAEHPPFTQQTHETLGLNAPFDSTLPMQHQSDSATTMSLVLHPHEQHNAEPAGDVQNVSATPMGPPLQPRKKKAPTLRANAWLPYKSHILDLHITQGLPLQKVQQRMKDERGFTAELRQYRMRISQWGKDKNVKPQEMKAIVRKRQHRKLIEKNKGELVFEVRGNQVEPRKIERWMKSHDVPESFLYPNSPAAPTPSAVYCHTISDRGSPALLSSVHSPAASILLPVGSHLTAQNSPAFSPALSVWSIVRVQGSVFTGQSPALTYRPLSGVYFDSPDSTSSDLHDHMDIDTVPLRQRYRQRDEERLRDQLFRAEMSFETSPNDTSDMLSKLGQILLEQGRYKAAEEVIRRLVEGHRIQSGDDSINTLKALHLLGQTLAYQGLYVNAERLCRRALEGKEKVLGLEHPDTLASNSALGLMLEEQGKYKEAEVMLCRAVKGEEKVLGLEHPDTLISVSCLGSVLKEQGKYKEAEAMQRRALEGSEKVLGPEHPDTLISVSCLGSVLKEQGKYKEAEAMQRRALEGLEKVLGPEHPDTLISVSCLGLVLIEQGKYKEVEAMYRRAITILEKVLGLEHPNTLISVSCLGSVLEKQGKYQEVEAMHQRALEGLEKVLGLEHPNTLRSVGYLGLVLERQGKYKEAEAMQRRALEGLEKVLGLEHPRTLVGVNRLALVLQSQGRLVEAEDLEVQVVESIKAVLGNEHPDTLTAMKDLAVTLKLQGRNQEAVLLMVRCCESRKRVIGAHHPDTKSALEMLDRWRMEHSN